MRAIALHGCGQNPRVAKSLFHALERKCKLEVSCPRGWYDSSTKGGYSWYNKAKGKIRGKTIGADRDYERFAAYLGDRNDTVLVGFSEGGRFALNFAARYPEKVAVLVVMCFPFPESDYAACPMVHVPTVLVSSEQDDYENREDLNRLLDLFSEPVVAMHDKGHKVHFNSAVYTPIKKMIASYEAKTPQ